MAISNRNGPVTVEQASGDELTISGEKRASTREGVDSISIDVVQGKRFVISVRFSGGPDYSNRSMNLRVAVPSGVSVDRATTANGDISTAGIRGDLHAVTSNGDIEVIDVSGVVRGETTNGNVRIRNTTGLAGARSGNGNLDVDLLEMHRDVTCYSTNGNVTVRVGPAVSAAFRLSTNSGNAVVGDLPHSISMERKGYISGSLRGGEAPVLLLGTTNGDVTLLPA